MSVVCPICGTMLKVPMVVDLNLNEVRMGSKSRNVHPPQVVELLSVLLSAWPRTISYEAISDQMWGVIDDRSSVHRRQHLAALASMARVILRDMNVTIEAVTGRGYRLVLPVQHVTEEN